MPKQKAWHLFGTNVTGENNKQQLEEEQVNTVFLVGTIANHEKASKHFSGFLEPWLTQRGGYAKLKMHDFYHHGECIFIFKLQVNTHAKTKTKQMSFKSS